MNDDDKKNESWAMPTPMLSEYFHVSNSGTTFAIHQIRKYPHRAMLRVSNGFFGQGGAQIWMTGENLKGMTPDELRRLATMFARCAQQLELEEAKMRATEEGVEIPAEIQDKKA